LGVTDAGRARHEVFHPHPGHLDPSWEDWFEGLEITHEEQGSTLLTGSLRDQAALYGILLKIRQLGLTLLSLEEEP
jgi:hypothetical protein